MATFQPSYSEIGDAAYSKKAPNVDTRLESFFWKLLLLTALTYFVWSDAINIWIGPISIEKTHSQLQPAHRQTDLFGMLGFSGNQQNSIQLDEGALDNLTFIIDPGYADRFGISDAQVLAHSVRCSLFVKRFSPVAIAEMRRYGVPASILLAQALLASNAGDNPICRETNNFFMRSCLSDSCDSEHFADLGASADLAAELDEFPNLWGSFRAQSLLLLQTKPFSKLFQLPKNDYRAWAAGLGACAYSPDAQYGDKLVAIIQGLDLQAFDVR